MRREEPTAIVPLGSAWAGNSVNCVPFRISGMLSRGGVRYASFYDSSGDVVVTSVVADRPAARVRLPNARKPFDAHVAVSLGLDADGHLHIAYGAHDSPMQIARTRGPGLAEEFLKPVRLVGHFTEQTSYPMFVSAPPSGDLILLFRDGSAASGDLRAMRFDRVAARWRDDPVALISGRSGNGWQAGPYLNTPAIGPDGEVVLFLVWRLDPRASSAGAVNNSGIDCLISRDGLHHLATAGGVDLALPVTPATAERVIAVPLGANLINQAAAAVRADGAPMVATYWDDERGIPQYRLGWREGASWRVSTISRFSTRFRLDGAGTLPLPHSRPELLLDSDGTAHVIFRSREFDGRLVITSVTPPDYALAAARHRILVDEDLGFYEPVVDRLGWLDGELALHVQWCEQESGGDTKTTMAAAEARVMTWRRERLS
jgi:hypothetical protein